MCNSYPLIYKNLVVQHYLSRKKEQIKSILTKYNIARSTLYKWINLHKQSILFPKMKYKKKSKVNSTIKKWIYKYVLRRKTFSYIKILSLILSKFNLQISKSTLYVTLKQINITRKKFQKRFIYKTKYKHQIEIKKFENKLIFNFI